VVREVDVARLERRKARRAVLDVVLCLVMLTRAAAAQESSALERAERHADRGEVEAAREALAGWQSEFESSATLNERARAWYLAARLAEDGATAEFNYLRVVIEGSATAYADDALLRLAQFKYSQGEHSKAIEYLGRLRRDYPTSEHNSVALLWLSRTASAMGDAERACEAAEQGLRELPPGDAELERSLHEERGACEQTARAYTVQVGAFNDAGAAQALARELLAHSFDAWVLNATPQDPLYRVRVGRGLIEAEAETLADRLVAAGYSAFLVSQSSEAGGL
jgi:tetratricopeptide (TPR) repeat protein